MKIVSFRISLFPMPEIGLSSSQQSELTFFGGQLIGGKIFSCMKQICIGFFGMSGKRVLLKREAGDGCLTPHVNLRSGR